VCIFRMICLYQKPPRLINLQPTQNNLKFSTIKPACVLSFIEQINQKQQDNCCFNLFLFKTRKKFAIQKVIVVIEKKYHYFKNKYLL